MNKVLKDSFQRLQSELHWLPSDLGKVLSPKIRKEHEVPSEALICQVSSNAFVVLYHETGLKWSVSTFFGNEHYLRFAKRLTITRADFAVFMFLLEEIIEATEYSLSGLLANFPEKTEEGKELKKFLVATKKILADEEAIERTPEVYKI